MKQQSSILFTILIIFFSLLTTQATTVAQTSQDSTSITPSDNQKATYVKGVTAMRARALVGVALGLVSLIIGWRAKRRAAAAIGNKGRSGAVIAILSGSIAIVLSIFHISVTAGAVFGSGSGKAGAIFALILGLAGTILSAQVLRKKT